MSKALFIYVLLYISFIIIISISVIEEGIWVLVPLYFHPSGLAYPPSKLGQLPLTARVSQEQNKDHTHSDRQQVMKKKLFANNRI